MRLSKIALLALRGMDRNSRISLAGDLGITENTLYKWVRTNDDSLTKAACLMVLQRELGISQEHLLELAEEAA